MWLCKNKHCHPYTMHTQAIFIGYLPVHHMVCDKSDIGTPNCFCSCASKCMVSPYGVYGFYQDSYNSQVVASAGLLFTYSRGFKSDVVALYFSV